MSKRHWSPRGASFLAATVLGVALIAMAILASPKADAALFNIKVQAEAMAKSDPGIPTVDGNNDDGLHVEFLPGAPQAYRVSTTQNFAGPVSSIDIRGQGVTATEDLAIYLDDGTSPIATVSNWSSTFEIRTVAVSIPAGQHTISFGPPAQQSSTQKQRLDWAQFNGDSSTPPPAQCADGQDNDGDGLVDLNDPGCSSSSDTDETNVVTAGAELIGAGDIADGSAGAGQTAALIKQHPDAQVFLAGDNAYNAGTLNEYKSKYDPSWGAFKSRTNPTPGNHEYNTANAQGYKDYFGARAMPNGTTYYAKDVGSWRVYYLDSNIGTTTTSAQYAWLQKDLAANPRSCSIGVWHYPVFSSGEHGNLSKMKAIYALMDSKGVDVVLNGHDHDYERFAPQSSSGSASASGIQEFVVGSGGTSELRPMNAAQPNSVVRVPNQWGVLDLQLNSSNYSWSWIKVNGNIGDSGSRSCVN